MHKEFTILEDIVVHSVPDGIKTTLSKGKTGIISQSLGNNYTIIVEGNMYQLNGIDGEKIGEEKIEVSSNNFANEEEVWNVFNNHSEMILNKDHIVSSKINWKEKSLNVQEMAQELDLSLDSFVFWDDNPLERNKMRTILPQVHTFDVPQEVIYWPKILRANINFAKFYITEEDKNKSKVRPKIPVDPNINIFIRKLLVYIKFFIN